MERSDCRDRRKRATNDRSSVIACSLTGIASRPRPGPWSDVQLVDRRLVLLGDRRSLELHRRRELFAAGLPLVGQHPETLDLLDAAHALIGRRDRARDLLLQLVESDELL